MQVDPNSFKILIDYIYQGRCQVPYDSITTVDLLANQCGLPLLMQQLGKKAKEKKSFGKKCNDNLVIKTNFCFILSGWTL